MDATEALIIPQDGGDLISIKPKAKKRRRRGSGRTPKAQTFPSLKPLDNGNHFVRYYRAVVRSVHKDAKFYPFESERNNAMKIIDLLIENKRGEDKAFLRSWITYYAKWYLKGSFATNEFHTGLKSFMGTFKEFHTHYFN